MSFFAALRKSLTSVCFAALPAIAQTGAKPVDFQREIRPILSNACFACHGPDKSTRMAGLRLDLKEEAFAQRKSGAAIVPGQSARSLLIARINHADPVLRMPPAHTKKTITAEQKALLKRWIDQGAPWKEHWAFAAPRRPPLPPVRNVRWVRNPVDRFILARLEAAGLQPAPEAPRHTLIRRASLDLTGLPPSPADVEAFLSDTSPDAYEKLVDRLLDSRAWGEHRARYWLDAARYGDTHGIHIDNYREIWPYRDWVISAFNANMPFDQFTIEQLAGDLLPKPTLRQRIATGFHRCNITTNEGGAIPEEFDAIYQKDRVDTTGAVWLGLTIGCASCHDHKFDPVSQKEFYQMVAFFKNTLQHPMDGNIPDTPPVVVVPRDEDLELWQSLEDREAELRQRRGRREQEADEAFRAWAASPARRAVTRPIGEGELVAAPGPIEFKTKAPVELDDVPVFDAARPFTFSAWVYLPRSEDNLMVVSRVNPDRSNGWTLEINARIPIFQIYGDDAKDRLLARASNADRLKPGEWVHIAAAYDGSRDQSGLALYVNGKPTANEGRGDSTRTLTGNIRNYLPLRLGWDGRGQYFLGGVLKDIRVFSRALSPEEVAVAKAWADLAPAIGADSLTALQHALLRDYFLVARDPEYMRISAAIESIRAERRAIRRRGAVTHVMQEKPGSKPVAHVLFRGMYDQPREEVGPGVPSVFPPMSPELPRNRLGLAKWLVDPGHPTMARVTVNRFWQEVFGAGIVRSSEDFGATGSPPSHPELLDWLAVEFRERNWDVKAFYRMLVTSAAYRQSAQATPAKLEKDPDNALLSRGPRFRMDAEMVRDYALAAGGLLSAKIGGPSVKPYQPDGVWETVAMNGSNTRFYKRDSGESLYRRSLYTFWKRSAPPPSMDIFNAPSRENCSVRRERTNTPLQALVTMNDVQFVEAARHLAANAMKAADGFEGRLDYLTARSLARSLDPAERDVVRAAYADFLRHYDSRPDAARRLIRMGETRPDESLGAPELAAWTMVASQILNTDEALNK